MLAWNAYSNMKPFLMKSQRMVFLLVKCVIKVGKVRLEALVFKCVPYRFVIQEAKRGCSDLWPSHSQVSSLRRGANDDLGKLLT